MDEIDILLVKESIFKDNNQRAELLREELRKKKLTFVNVMSSPGSGKTSTLVSLIKEIGSRLNIAVMEADIDSDCDAKTIKNETQARCIQLHTGGMCHLDAGMTKTGLDGIDISDLDIIFLENVGNLVCPAEFDTGASMDMMILSIPEGDDKPLKYPLVFEKSDLVLINKIDTIKYFDFDFTKCEKYIKMRNKDATIIPISAKTGEGLSLVADYFIKRVARHKEQ